MIREYCLHPPRIDKNNQGNNKREKSIWYYNTMMNIMNQYCDLTKGINENQIIEQFGQFHFFVLYQGHLFPLNPNLFVSIITKNDENLLL